MDDLLFGEAYTNPPDRLEEEVASAMASRLGVDPARSAVGCWRPHVAAALSEIGGDVDTSLMRWLLEGVPLGIDAEIGCHGVFPPAENDREGTNEAANLWTRVAEGCYYQSFDEDRDWVIPKLQEMERKGQLTRFASLAEAQKVHGDVIVNKAASLVKCLDDGTLKHRIIIDLLRSGANWLCWVPERGVLPRVFDATADSRRLLFLSMGGGFPEMVVLDVEEAFYTLGVLFKERRFLFIQSPDGTLYRLNVLAMGGASAPLLWGRAAAFLMRLSASIYHKDVLRLQCFVDDPWLIARGTPRARRTRIVVVILLWLSVGLRLSWRKKQVDFQVKWIGVVLGLTRQEVIVWLPADFVLKVLTEIKEIQLLRAIPARRLRKLTGSLTWISGVVIWIRAFIAPLWAAVAEAARWEGPPTEATVGQRQVSHALRWLRLFLEGNQGELVRRIAAAPKQYNTFVQIVTDACPWGLGGVLLVNGTLKNRWACALEDLDLEMLEATRGSPDGQASFEALALLVALRQWQDIWKEEATFILTRSDSIAALGALLKGNSHNLAMNKIMQEIALDMAEGIYEPQVVGHLPASWNGWADALSRLAVPGASQQLPEELARIEPDVLAVRDRAWWRTQSGGY